MSSATAWRLPWWRGGKGKCKCRGQGTGIRDLGRRNPPKMVGNMALLDPIPAVVVNADSAALEWEPLLALVAGFAASPVGRAAILAFHPSTDETWIRQQHQLTGEVRLLLDEQVSIPLGGLFDPTQLADKARIPDAALDASELQAVARLANDIAAWQSLLQTPPARVVGRLPGLSLLSGGLSGSLRPLAESIERKIQPDGSLADDASPELNRIRREQERQQRLIEESLRAALRKSRAQRAQAARERGYSRRQLFGPDGVCRAARNYRAKQRARSPHRRRA